MFDLDDGKLGDEFFPAYLSIALIDAIFTSRIRYCQQVVPIIDRYCARFNLRRVCPDRMKLPPVDEQEMLTDLIHHYKVLGPGGFQKEIVRSRYCSLGTTILKSKNVKRAAIGLQGIEIATLQDAQQKDDYQIRCVLRRLPGIKDRTIHMFLMYTGDDEYVKGDTHIRRFVAKALHRPKAAAEEAERLVRCAARALRITPRLLDYEIRKYGAYPNRQ